MIRTAIIILLAFAAAEAVAQPHIGFVPQHEIIAKARDRAREDWRAGRLQPADGREASVQFAGLETPTGSGLATQVSGMAPYHEPFELGEVIYDGDGAEACVGGCGGCANNSCGNCGSCGSCRPLIGVCGPRGGGFDAPCGCGLDSCRLCCPRSFCGTLEVSWGVQGFTGPVNRGGTGSFGFHEAFNLGVKVPGALFGQWGAQLGARGVHSNFSGSNFSNDSRNQLFITGGVFRRSDFGLQTGIVVDYLTEDWHIDSDVLQLRGEASFAMHGTGDLGVMFRSGINDDNVTFLAQNFTVEPTDIYALFFRHEFMPCGAGEARIYAGFSGESDGLLGGDFRMPLTRTLSIDGGWAYLIPEQPTPQGGTINESWNVFLGMSWQPGAPPTVRNYYRPLFRVADNGSFFRDME